MISFEPKIDVGTLLAFAALMFTFYRYHNSNISRLTKIETRVELMWSALRARLNMSDENE
jgi:hypothetical protein